MGGANLVKPWRRLDGGRPVASFEKLIVDAEICR